MHSVTDGHSELNEAARITNEQTKERTHHVTFLNLYIDNWVIPDIRYNFGDEMTRKKIHLLKFLSLCRYVPHIPP